MASRAEKAAQELAVEAASATHLEVAVGAVTREKWALARGALGAAWHVRPSTRVAALVAILEDRLPKPELEGRTVAEREARWHALAMTEDLENLSTMLAAPWPVHPGQALERVNALAKWPRSPRIANALFAVHSLRLYTSSVGRKLSRQIFRILIEQGDPTVSVYLARLERDLDTVDRSARSTLLGIMKRHRPEDPIPGPREAAALAQLEAGIQRPVASTATRSYSELLAAVYAAPWDDGPRAVLADLLIEGGDPRGELIVLQLQRGTKRASDPRERAMLRQAGNTWFDGLDKLGAYDIELARGFPVAATTRATEFPDPAWATIEALSIDPRNAVFRGAPTLRGLRRLYGLPVAHLSTVVLPNNELDVLTVIGLDGLRTATSLAPRVLGLGDIPRQLSPDLIDRTRRAIAELHIGPVGRRVTELHLPVKIMELPLAFDFLAAQPQLDTVVILGDYDRFARQRTMWSARVTRSRLELTWVSPGAYGMLVEAVVQVLTKLEPPTVTAVEVVLAGKVDKDSKLVAVRTRLTEIIHGWPAVTDAKILVPVGRRR